MSTGLSGKRIVNTRAVHQAQALNDKLRLYGAIAIEYPCIAIKAPEDRRLLDASLVDLAAGKYEWLVLTSANTVFALQQHLQALGLTLSGTAFRTAAIGPSTAEAALGQLGLSSVDLPASYVAESLAASIPVEVGTRVLLPESAIARPTLDLQLSARGAQVTVVTAYQTVCGSGGADVPQLLAQKQVDAITFTSSSTVTYFIERLQQEGGSVDDALAVPAACIGPQTATTAHDCGFTILELSSEHTLDGLVNVLDTHLTPSISR